eukprot:TRINITY_DN4672_c0_g1_i1.p1 TRINITY_DN4672_c0_g1~~TRINITY_DN4672_c0_g1_i1.p1  ORF type:complete len:475 (-),score=174.96 TRINITY_DN4672_c0_g1_i1:213-1637(-)
MAPPFEPTGEPVRSGKMDNGDATWDDYEDKTRIQKNKDGSTIYIYQGTSKDHGIQQFSAMPDGTEVTYYVDGRRKQKFPNGAILEVNLDKSRTQTNPDGTKIQTFPDGKTFQTNPNGTSLEIFPDDALFEGAWLLNISPSDEQGRWPPIKRIQKGANTTHYIGNDGNPPTDVQIDKEGMMIVRWASGTFPIAEAHYQEFGQEYCMQVDQTGNTEFLCKLGVESSADGQATSWALDRWWYQEKERKETAAREAAEAAARAEREAKEAEDRQLREAQEAAERKKREAKEAEERRQREAQEEEERRQAAAEAKRIEEEARKRAAMEAKLAADLERVQREKDEAERRDREKKERLAREKEAAERREIELREANRLRQEAAERAQREADEREARLAEERAEQKRREDEQARLNDSKKREEAERAAVLLKYKLYPYIKMKNFLKNNGVPKNDVDACLGKYELKKLADSHSVALPDDPKSL